MKLRVAELAELPELTIEQSDELDALAAFIETWEDKQLRRRVTRELPVMPEQSWRYYDGMTRERFEELKAAGALPLTVGTYDEIQRIVAEAKASSS